MKHFDYLKKMSGTYRLASMAFLLLSFAFYMGCGSTEDGIQPIAPDPDDTIVDPGDEPRELTMWEYLDGDRGNQFTILLKVLEEAGLRQELEDTNSTQRTIFAVLDKGFNRFIARKGYQTSQEFYSNPELAGIMDYHLVDDVLISIADLPSDGEFLTPVGDRIFVQKSDQFGVWLNGRARVVTRDIITKNGVIHVVDDVIEPPVKSIYQHLNELGNFTTFLNLMQENGLSNVLNNPGQRTVFAPTDDAFTRIFNFLDQEIFLENMTEVEQLSLLLNHVVFDTKFSYEFGEGVQLTTFDTERNRTLEARLANNGDIFVNGYLADDKGIDYRATNGAVHIVDDVLVPAPKVVDYLYYNPDDFSALYAALKATGLDATLDGLPNITLFAPTNAGLVDSLNSWLGTSNLAGMSTAELAAVSEVLQYHLLATRVTSFDLVEDRFYRSALTPAFQFVIDGTTASLSDALRSNVAITAVNQEATNGFVHAIEGPIRPPIASIYSRLKEIVIENGEFRFLVEAIELTAGNSGDDNLVNVLSSTDRNFTFLAPTNSAIGNITGGDPATIVNFNLDTLTEILKYHVIEGGRFHSTDLVSQSFLNQSVEDEDGDFVVPVTTLQGSTIGWTGVDFKEAGALYADPNNSPLHRPQAPIDIIATNGVIHGWNGVLFP